MGSGTVFEDVVPEVVATGTGFGEGPVWRPATGDLVVTSVSDGVLYRVDLGSGLVELFADVGGGPNGALLCADGGILVAQNGGIDLRPYVDTIDIPPVRPVPGGLQRVSPSGEVESVSPEAGFDQPNDLAVDLDGSVVFSDLVHADNFRGTLRRLGVDRSVTVVEALPHYLNGVGAVPGGLLTAEAEGLRRLGPGDRSWLLDDLGQVDGFAADVEGRIYACRPRVGIAVVEPGDAGGQGRVVGWLALPDGHFVTNCCFGGPDLRTLYATDAGNGRVLAWNGLPAPGHPLDAFVWS